MNIKDFISTYRNHPVLFVGTGMSLRYLKNSYTWDGLLKKISFDLKGNAEYYLDLKSQCEKEGKYDFSKLAALLESDFNKALVVDRYGKFKDVNNIFYEGMENNKNTSRFKIYISQLIESLDVKDDKIDEIAEFKKVRKNVGSIITTNYDRFVETVFEFDPLIGNDILLSNPYGSVYKIHGCISDPLKIIITDVDYKRFDEKYELIRAQLLSIFIHNPIVFLGYNIGDENIKSILKTIFTYIQPNSKDAERIRKNFLLVEYEAGSTSQETGEHDIDLEGFSTIRINKIKTDNFSSIFAALADLMLPISAMDVRKVQNIVKEIYAGGDIKVKITEDLDSLNNSDKILAIGSSKTITYHYQTATETMSNYFNIIDESNSQVIALVDKYNISRSQYFPIFGFSKIFPDLKCAEKLKKQQKQHLEAAIVAIPIKIQTKHTSIEQIYEDIAITPTNKANAILWSFHNDLIDIKDCEEYLRKFTQKKETSYRKLLCAYDLKKYGQ